MNIRFSEYRPSLPLRRMVQSYWTGDFNLYSENRFVQSVVPNACIELIIHLTHDHCELKKDDQWTKTPEFILIGLQTGVYEVRFNSVVQVFGIRFNPDGIYSIFGVPPSQFTGTYEECRDILGPGFDEYCYRLRSKKSVREKIELTENFLLKKQADRKPGSGYLERTPMVIRRHQGLISMEDLLNEIPISRRQLQREFKNKFGITAKEYMRLSRMNAIQRYMLSENVRLTDLTYEVGFADQSHFTREFKLLIGINPKKFIKKRENYIVTSSDFDDL